MAVFLSIIIINLLIGILLASYLPWWFIAITAFIIGMIQGRALWSTFLGGFLAISLSWLGYTAYLETLSEGRLTSKVALIFGLSNSFQLMLITILLGGIVSGLASSSGYLLKRIFFSPR